jgi:aryl carrier-like protein
VTREHLAGTIAGMAGVAREDVRGDADLTALGLGSLDILRLVNEYRMRGVPVTYRELATEPTLDAWWARISHLLRANPHLAA